MIGKRSSAGSPAERSSIRNKSDRGFAVATHDETIDFGDAACARICCAGAQKPIEVASKRANLNAELAYEIVVLSRLHSQESFGPSSARTRRTQNADPSTSISSLKS